MIAKIVTTKFQRGLSWQHTLHKTQEILSPVASSLAAEQRDTTLRYNIGRKWPILFTSWEHLFLAERCHSFHRNNNNNNNNEKIYIAGP